MAARTLAQLQQGIYNYGYGSSSDTSFVTAATDFLNEEYRDVAGERRWEWLQNTASIFLNAGVSTAPLTSWASNIRNIDAVLVRDAQNNAVNIQYMDPIQLIALSEDNITTTVGPPRYWGVWGGQMFIWPSLDQTYTFAMLYTMNVVALVNPGDIPLIPEAYDDVLVWGGVQRMAIRQHDWVTHSFAGQQRDRVLGLMRADYQLKQRQNSDRVETSGLYGGGLDPGPQWHLNSGNWG